MSHVKKYCKDMSGLIGVGVGIGVGNAVLNEIPGSSGIVTGMNKGTSMLGVLGTTVGANAVLGELTKMGKKSKY